MHLETERLILRKFKEEDVNDLFEYFPGSNCQLFIDMKIGNLKDAKKECKIKQNCI